MYSQITVARAGKSERIAVVTMNRPDKLNALTKVMEAELRDAMEAVDRDDDVRVVVLTGAGKASAPAWTSTSSKCCHRAISAPLSGCARST